MTYHTRRCEVCEGLFTFRTTPRDLRDLWQCVECRERQAAIVLPPQRIFLKDLHTPSLISPIKHGRRWYGRSFTHM